MTFEINSKNSVENVFGIKKSEWQTETEFLFVVCQYRRCLLFLAYDRDNDRPFTLEIMQRVSNIDVIGVGILWGGRCEMEEINL